MVLGDGSQLSKGVNWTPPSIKDTTKNKKQTRVINFEFPLQPNQKYNITQYDDQLVFLIPYYDYTYEFSPLPPI